MTSTLAFLLAAALLLAVVLTLLLRPLLRRPPSEPDVDERRQANLRIFRDELRELERERAEGSLAEADFAQARDELQRRLLAELPPGKGATAAGRAGGKRTALALLFAVPLTAIVAYAALGTPQALEATHSQAQMSAQEIDALLQKLADRLQAKPEDTRGWIMLARSYKALGRHAEAAEAFARAGAAVDADATLLADYAEALANANGRLAGRPEELIGRALKLDPDEPQALFLAGAAAQERQDFAAVVKHWSRLLPQLPPESEDARALQAAVDKARALSGQPATKAKPEKSAKQAAAIVGEVVLGAQLAGQAKADDTLFVFARADEGPRMPIAVIRARVAELPLRFRLDDSQALPGGRRLSEFASVTIEARIARAGMAQTASGDLFGLARNVRVGEDKLRLTIDQVQP